MAERDKIFQTKIKHKGLFDYKELYRFAYTYLADEGYLITEKEYTEKVTGDSKLVELQWEAWRKISDYFKFFIKIEWRIVAMKTVEATENGKKVKVQEGDLTIKINGSLERDYESRWEASAFRKFLRGVYDKYIIKGRIDDYEGKLFAEMDEYASQLKSFLVLVGGQH